MKSITLSLSDEAYESIAAAVERLNSNPMLHEDPWTVPEFCKIMAIMSAAGEMSVHSPWTMRGPDSDRPAFLGGPEE